MILIAESGCTVVKSQGYLGNAGKKHRAVVRQHSLGVGIRFWVSRNWTPQRIEKNINFITMHVYRNVSIFVASTMKARFERGRGQKLKRLMMRNVSNLLIFLGRPIIGTSGCHATWSVL